MQGPALACSRLLSANPLGVKLRAYYQLFFYFCKRSWGNREVEFVCRRTWLQMQRPYTPCLEFGSVCAEHMAVGIPKSMISPSSGISA